MVTYRRDLNAEISHLWSLLSDQEESGKTMVS